MDKDSVKSQLVRDKEFLRQLYETTEDPRAKQILTFASDQQLNTLIKFLHFVSNGEIKLKKQHFDVFSKSQVTLMKKSFEKKKALKQFLKPEREKPK